MTAAQRAARTYRYEGPTIYQVRQANNLPIDMTGRILEAVERHTGISYGAMKSRNNRHSISNARHMAIAYIYIYSRMSYDEIGQLFNRDHSTAIHSRKQARNLIEVDRAFTETMFAIYTDITA
jgi:chromosomal replication initiation ATPase DnaA